MQFKPIKYVVPGIIVEGLTLLAGKPKLGKSWLLLHAAIAVASGGVTLGGIRCAEGDVLYCALEDSLRRLQSRMVTLLGMEVDWPKRLHFETEMPRLGDGGLEQITAWISSVPNPRLVIVDTLAMVRTPKSVNQTQYDADYAALKELRDLASEHGIAIIVVHHLRKAGADDAFDTVSGTLGLTGAPDAILILKREVNGSTTLQGRGRDLIEFEKAISFDRTICTWAITGNAIEARISSDRKAILDALSQIGEPASPSEIAAHAGLKRENVKKIAHRMANDNILSRTAKGKYSIGDAGTFQ